MRKALGLLVATSVGAAATFGFYHHPPFHLPPPLLTNLIPLPPPPPRQLTKVISASACTLVNGFTWNGPGVTATYGAVLIPAGDFIINPNSPDQGDPTNPNTPPDTLLLFCDARLPDDTVSFDYAELEYFAPNVYANHGPTIDSYLDARAPNINGYAYSQTMPLGSCTGGLSTLYAGTNPVSLCATDGGQSFLPDAGVPGVWPGAGWSLFSIHFIVTIPPSPNPTLPNIVYRVIAHYSAP